MRVAKFMAQAGLCSRRDAERWIQEGRVSVNGEILQTPGVVVTSEDRVVVDENLIELTEIPRLWIYHKPARLLTTHYDPEGRETVFDTLPSHLPRVISVGRLDMFSEGLLLLTTSGALARTLELPQTGLARTYQVCVGATVSAAQQERINQGLTIEGVHYTRVHVRVEKAAAYRTWLVFTLHEGKNREIRRIADFMGWHILCLKRTAYGPFTLDALPAGDVREVPLQNFQGFLDA